MSPLQVPRPAAARPAILLVLALVLAGCALPRGAAIEREITGGSAGAGSEDQDFQVAPVSRQTLGRYAAWPAVNETAQPWIGHSARAATRILAAGDTVAVTVWSTEENGLLTNGGQRSVNLTGLRLSPAGEVFLPYVGRIRLAGLTPDTARDRIEEAYLKVSPSAQVQFDFTEGRQNTVSLLGGVGAPGSYPMPDRSFTVLGLLAEGGGLSPSLKNPQIRLHRGGRVFGIPAERLLDEPALDTVLQGGDRVLVEADRRSFLSLGAAGSQAEVPFTREKVTALDAMAMIGGVNPTRGDPQGILVLRRYPATALRQDDSGPGKDRVIFTLDLTSADGLFSAGEFLIRPGDLVYVTESPINSARTVFGLIGSVFGLVSRIPD